MGFALTVTLVEPDAALLAEKAAELQRIEQRITRCEQDIAALRLKLSEFFARYSQRLGHLIAELAELEARIAAQWRESMPHELLEKMEADFLRGMAEDARRHNRRMERQQISTRRAPPDDLKRLYRMACRRVHPDRGHNEADRQQRHHAMSAINQAYRDGDADRIRQILDSFVAGADAAHTETRAERRASRLMQLLCRIAEAIIRLQAIRRELKEVKNLEMNRLRQTVEAREKAGEDPLGDMAAELRESIREAKSTLRKARSP